ncbi:aminotransferase class I/II-fold pyridoxal phosphate-dependent enzyme [Streptomyces sp. N2-109]|uniref:histidinol-phosphate transaminase n=1 Tax=Streptomyces gossypii TaxID=2883101 RepID=A0ABT2JSR0_9ACTN|nr:aminotransferase class I/II-fold pyridoxal phosphate-dependent enzyme [Streptomyces gossypii]MCT2590524.1 aminotransferase class I/II-fold pyridoxal phosphate-dependent enzyme [Streptomyces gossypii]
MSEVVSLSAWHAACNSRAAEEARQRVRQFALRPVSRDGWPWREQIPLPGEVWAWQQIGAGGTEAIGLRQSFPIRVGFAGDRLHLGHLGLARVAAQLTSAGGRLLVFDSSGSGSMLEGFTAAVRHYSEAPAELEVCRESPALRQTQHQALAELRVEKLRRLYGWDGTTSASALLDVAAMLGFFLHSPGDFGGGGVALVDTLQAPHSALLPRLARAMGREAPVLLYRRLFPSLRRAGERGSVHDEASVVFGDDDETTIRRKFHSAVTGGRDTAQAQRELGGEAVRCSAFAMIELACSRVAARSALDRCRSGRVLCADCKDEHADIVSAGVRAAVTPSLRAGQTPQVREAVAGAAGSLHRPPRRRTDQLEERLAWDTGVRAEQVVAGHGSTEVMDWLFAAQARTGGSAIATEPTFELYEHLAERHRLAHHAVPWDRAELGHNVPALSAAIEKANDTVLCILDIPHTVSGTVPRSLPELLRPILRVLPERAVVLLDMVSADYMCTSPALTQLLDSDPRVVITGSLSKAHCLLGARVGYALAAASLAERLRSRQLPYAMDSLALAAAEAALDDDTARQRNVAASHQARDRLTALLRQLGIRHAPSEANVLLMDLGIWFTPVARRLEARGARYRDGRRWGLPGWMQVNLIDIPHTDPVIDALQQTARGDNNHLDPRLRRPRERQAHPHD